MRKLAKLPEPEELAKNQADWTAEYLAAPTGDKPSPWRHDEIIRALNAETYGKCAYCESNMGSVSYPHVEHIKPKTTFPDLVVNWVNLTLACQVCNTNKSTYYSDIAPLLNPYEGDPLLHLSITGPIVEGRPGSSIGRRTVDKLRLCRPDLIIARAKRIQALHSLIERWASANDDDKEIMTEVILDELSDEREFAQVLRCYSESLGFFYERERPEAPPTADLIRRSPSP